MKRILFLACMFIGLSSALQAQEYYKRANELYDLNNFKDAIPFYQKELEENDDPRIVQDATFRLAECYRLLNQHAEAEKVYKKFFTKSKRDPKVIFNYANFLKGIGKYKEAQVQYRSYAKLAPTDSLVKFYIASCDSAIKWQAESNTTYIRNVKEFNSVDPDMSPLVSGNLLFFSSSRETAMQLREQRGEPDPLPEGSKPPKPAKGAPKQPVQEKAKPDYDAFKKPLPTLDLFLANFHDTLMQVKKPRLLEELASSEHEGPATINAGGDEMYFTRTADFAVKNKALNAKVNNLLLMQTKKHKERWTSPVDTFAWNNPWEYSVGHPALSPDGKSLFFMSDAPDGYGGTDLYYSRLTDSGWAAPVNLGLPVNTPGFEMFPYVREDGTLFFSSNFHPGMGNLDIFSVKYDSSTQKWGTVENLKPPFNSSWDDFGISFTQGEEKGFFTSRRWGGNGDDDIYSFIRNKEIRLQYDGNQYSLKNEFFFDQLTYSLTDTLRKTEDNIEGTGERLYFSIKPNTPYTLNAKRGNEVVNKVDLYYGTGSDGQLQLAMGSDKLPLQLAGTIRSSDASLNPARIAEGIAAASPASVAVPGLALQIKDPSGNVVQETRTDSSGAFACKTFKAGNIYKMGFGNMPVTAVMRDTNTARLPLKLNVLLTNKTGAPLAKATVIVSDNFNELQRKTSDASGRITLMVPRSNKLVITGIKEGYFQQEKRLNSTAMAQAEWNDTLVLPELKGDTSIQLLDIYYDFAKATLRPESKEVLERMLQFMKANESVAIELMSHTDEVGSDASNLLLSQKRAEAVTQYLVSKGIAAKRLLAIGYGEANPRVKNAKNAREHQQNRRTEFKLISINDIAERSATLGSKMKEIEARVQQEEKAEAALPREESDFNVAPHMGSGKIDGIVESKMDSGIIFKVQIASSETELPPDYFSGFKRVEQYKSEQGNYKYFGASSRSYDKALNSLYKIRSQMRITDAFLVIYKDGKRVFYDDIKGQAGFVAERTYQSDFAETAEPAPGAKVQYVIQIAALKSRRQNISDFNIPNLREKQSSSDGYFRYFVGPFDSWEKAREEQLKLISNGYPDAFIKSSLN